MHGLDQHPRPETRECENTLLPARGQQHRKNWQLARVPGSQLQVRSLHHCALLATSPERGLLNPKDCVEKTGCSERGTPRIAEHASGC